QAGRFRTADIHFAAGPEAFTPDLIAAAEWLDGSAGRFHLVIGDKSSSVAFATSGMQRTKLWATWAPFYRTDLGKVQQFLDDNHVEYVVVDLRDSRYLPRYQH